MILAVLWVVSLINKFGGYMGQLKYLQTMLHVECNNYDVALSITL
jgi:hypothetical protein